MHDRALSPTPSWLQLRPRAARPLVYAAAALGCGTCALGGFYPPYDGYELRLLLGALAALASTVVVWRALSRKTRTSAVVHTLLVGIALGVVTPLVPALVLTWERPHDLGTALMLSVLFGIPTGVAYAVPLAVLVGTCWPHLEEPTLASSQRVARIAGTWTLVGALAATWPTLGASRPYLENPSMWLLCGFECVLAVFACSFALVAQARIRHMEGWLDRVVAGEEPGFRARLRHADDVDLPTVRAGEHVIESVLPIEEVAYRDNAGGIPLCVG